jgi:hypothetical protein
MPSLPALPPEARRILDLARRDRRAARDAMAKLDLDSQVGLICTTPPSRRAELLDLAPHPEHVVPALPEAELCFTVKAIGLHDAGWVLSYATEDQLVTCLDLDAWRDMAPDRAAAGAWLRAVADGGEEALLRLVRAADDEVLVLMLASRIEVFLKPAGDDDWEPPPGARSLDGQFFFRARSEGDDLAEIEALLGALFQSEYWTYFRLLQAVIWELETETEEWALRWRSARLEDLGFPTWEEAMRIYGRLRAEELADLPEDERFHQVSEWPLPVWMPQLPAAGSEGPSLLRAMAALGEEERRAHLFAFLSLANQVAVADRLPLGDAETLPLAIDKATRLASLGLDHLAAAHELSPVDVLRRVALVRLFRVGVHLEGRESGPAT